MAPGRHLTDNIFKCIFMHGKFCISIRISLKYVLKNFYGVLNEYKNDEIDTGICILYNSLIGKLLKLAACEKKNIFYCSFYFSVTRFQ